jgi:mannose-6-phosphate isomerase-like protein (cupin superfamily)
MKKLTLLVVAVAVGGLSAQAPSGQNGRGSVAGAQGRGANATGRAAPAPAPPAPPAGSAGTYKTNDELMAVLQRAIAANTDPNRLVDSPVANTDQYRINVVHRTNGAGAIAHAGNTELHYVIDGGATFVTGGKIVRPPQGSGGVATIEGGVSKHIGKGDIVIIPENSPHWYKDVDGSITYLEVRWLAPKR